MNRTFKGFYRLLIAGVLSLTLLAGCSRGGGGGSSGGSDGGGQSNSLKATASFTAGVIILDSQTESQIITSDDTSIIFNGTPTAVQTLKPCDIFIAQNTARKIESIEYIEGNTVIKTITPEFGEVFKDLDISGDIMLNEKHLSKASLPQSISVSVIKPTPRAIYFQNGGSIFTFTIKDHVLDADGDESTTYDQIVVNGTVVLDKPRAIVF